MDGCADSNTFHWVKSAFWCFAQDLFDEALDKGHSGHAADEDDFVNLLEEFNLASSSAFSKVGLVRSTMGCASDSSFVRVNVRRRCFGPEASAVKNGRSMSVLMSVESSILAFSAASFSLDIAIRSSETSTPV